MSETTPPQVAPHPPLEVYDHDARARRGYVDRLFDTSARHYWWINTVMSFGSGIWYRRQALDRAGIGAGMEILDVCMGSGQVSRAALQQVGRDGRVVGLDASLGMLAAARSHVRLPQVQAYVEQLPIADASFDALTMGYALRHVADLVGTFREYLRVLRPGGRVLIIEFAKPTNPLASGVLKLYLKHIVPGIARVAGRDASRMMRYFWDTIDACVPPDTIVDSLAAAGFVDPQRGGELELFAEYTATKPA
jgi:demethylmenaquinone methyltransferase/2-methoxy-6-polyprenyl-1,4-benzoquinol methylase